MITKEAVIEWVKVFLNDENAQERVHEGTLDYYYLVPTPERSDNLMPPSHVSLLILKETGEVFDQIGNMATAMGMKKATNAQEYKEFVAGNQQPIATIR